MASKDKGRKEVRKPKKDKKTKGTGHVVGAVSDLEARQATKPPSASPHH